MSEVARTNKALGILLGQEFTLPKTKDASTGFEFYRVDGNHLEAAQQTYEMGKRNEIEAAIEYDNVKAEEAGAWEAAYVKATGSSQAAKKESAESQPEWLDYLKRKQAATDNKRQAEKWHSIAYQRLETIREVYKKA